jgi:hypothetical protein
MKKLNEIFLAVLSAIIFSGCGLTGNMNTVTTYDADGRVVDVQEMSDDAVYYDRITKNRTAVNCTAGMTFEQCGLLVAIGGLVDVAKGYPARGMNGFELAAKVSGDIVSAVPYGAIGFVAYEALKRPGTVNVSGESTYSTNETHLTGNEMGDGNGIEVPNQSPTTTTTVPEVAE